LATTRFPHVEQRLQRNGERPPALGHRDAALEQDRLQLVDQPGAAVHQSRARPMQRLHVELRLFLHRDEPHRRPGSRFGDRFGIAVVVLLRLHVGLDVLR
jgi:hypothetical protein